MLQLMPNNANLCPLMVKLYNFMIRYGQAIPHILKTIMIKNILKSNLSAWATRIPQSEMGAIRASLGQVGSKLWFFYDAMRQYEYELICFGNQFCFANISAPFDRTEMALHSKCSYGSQFSGEKDHWKIRYLVAEIKSKYLV